MDLKRKEKNFYLIKLKYYSLILAIKDDSIILWQIVKGGCNQHNFYNFLFKLNNIIKNYTVKTPIFFMDNAKIHKTEKINDLRNYM
jgi:hypothetical protein